MLAPLKSWFTSSWRFWLPLLLKYANFVCLPASLSQFFLHDHKQYSFSQLTETASNFSKISLFDAKWNVSPFPGIFLGCVCIFVACVVCYVCFCVGFASVIIACWGTAMFLQTCLFHLQWLLLCCHCGVEWNPSNQSYNPTEGQIMAGWIQPEKSK